MTPLRWLRNRLSAERASDVRTMLATPVVPTRGLRDLRVRPPFPALFYLREPGVRMQLNPVLGVWDTTVAWHPNWLGRLLGRVADSRVHENRVIVEDEATGASYLVPPELVDEVEADVPELDDQEVVCDVPLAWKKKE